MTQEQRVAYRLASIGAGIVGAASQVRETQSMTVADRHLARAIEELFTLRSAVQYLEVGDVEQAELLLDMLMAKTAVQ